MKTQEPARVSPEVWSAEHLRELALECGADDARLVSLEHPDLAEEAQHARRALPGATHVLSLCVRMRREAIRTPERSIANHEFHHAGDEVGEVGRAFARHLEERGVRALVPAMGFPMEMQRFPGRIWTIAHKTVAQAAGLGVIGLHRSVIHPEFGSFILLGSVILELEVETPRSEPVASPCFECKLCVAACPVGAIRPDGYFDFSACYTRNYREFMGGFTDWVEDVAASRDAVDYRRRVDDRESVSMWQSLSYGASYKAAYCIGACPAGRDVIGPFEEDRRGFLERVVEPLRAKEEPLYVLQGADAERYAQARFPHKPTRRVGGGLRPVDLDSFLGGLPLVFQRDAAGDLDAVYHFRFTGEEQREATIRIQGGRVGVQPGLHGEAGLVVRADTRTWLRFVRKEQSLVRALLTRKVRLSGPPRLLVAFGRCFP